MSRKFLSGATVEGTSASPAGVLGINAKSISSIPLVVNGTTGQTADLQRWYTAAGGSIAANVTSNGQFNSAYLDILSGTNASYSRIYSIQGLYFDTATAGAAITFRPQGGVVVASASTSITSLIVRAAVSQTGFLQQWQKSDATVGLAIDADGMNMYRGGTRWMHGVSGAFLGFGAGNLAATANILNVGVGYLALTALTTGLSNVGVGDRALTALTTGGSNVAVGPLALAITTAANENTAIGNATLYQNTGIQNAAVGSLTLYNQTAASGNSALGAGAGYHATNGVTTGHHLTLLGHYTGLAGATQYNYSTALGAGALIGASNVMVLGGSTATDRTNVGIGISAPTARLHTKSIAVDDIGINVQGMAGQTAPLQRWADSSGTQLAHVRSDGLIGAPYFTDGADTGPYLGMSTASIAATGRGADTASPILSITTHLAAKIPFVVAGATSQTADLTQWRNVGGTVLSRVSAQGFLGIATLAGPTSQLHVRVGTDQNMLHGSYANGPGIASYNDAGTALGDLVFYGNKVLLAPSNSGNVGVGVTNPLAKLHVTTDAANRIGLTVQAVASQTADIQQWQTDTSSVQGRVDWQGILNFGYGRFGPVNGLYDYNALRATSQSTGAATVVIKAMAAQTANMTEWQNSAGVVLSGVTAGGDFATVDNHSFIAGNVTVQGTPGISWFTADAAGGYGIHRTNNTWAGPDYAQLRMAFLTGIILDPGSAFPKSYVDISQGGLRVNAAASQANLLYAQNAIIRVANGVTQLSFQIDNITPYVATIQHKSATADGSSFPIALNPLGGLVGIGTGATAPAGTMHVNSRSAATTVLVVQAAAAQTANLTEWKDSAGAVLALVRADGIVGAPGLVNSAQTGPALIMTATTASFNSSGAAQTPLIVKGFAAQTGNLTEWQDSAGAIVAKVTPAGQFAEKSVTFTPTAAGWYRIVVGSNMMGGTINIKGDYDIVQTDIEFQYNISGYAQGGSIQQTRWSMYNNGAVSAARISSDGVAQAYLDIQVVAIGGTYGPITVHARGMHQPALVATPVVGATVGSSTPFTLSFGHGFRTTSNIVLDGAIDFGTSVGEKLLLYGNSYGIGIQPNRLVIYASFGDAVSIRSSLTGADVIKLDTTGSLVQTIVSPSSIGHIIKGGVSQSAALTEWQNSAGTVLARMTQLGELRWPLATEEASASMITARASFAPNSLSIIGSGTTAFNRHVQIYDNLGVVGTVTSNGTGFYGPSLAAVANTGAYVSVNGANVVIFNRSSTGNVVFIVQGIAAQTGNLHEWRDSAGAALASMSASGRMTHKGFTVGTTAPSSPAVGDVWLDTT